MIRRSAESAWRVRARVIGAAVAIIGGSTLLGWVLDVSLLKQVAIGQASMKANTALCFMLAGAALALVGLRTAWGGTGVRAGSGLVLLIAGATLLEHLAGVDMGIDELMFADPDTPHALFPGRMAVATAVAFIVTSLSLLGIPSAARDLRVAAMARGFAACTLALGLFGLLGYVVSWSFLYTWYAFGSMAVHTALGFALLGVGLLAAGHGGAWARWPLGDSGRIVRAAALSLLLAGAVTGLAGVAALESQLRASVSADLRTLLDVQTVEVQSHLELSASRVAIMATRPNLRRHLRILASSPRDEGSRGVVQEVLESFLPFDFLSISVMLPGGDQVGRVGHAVGAAAFEMRLDGEPESWLLWQDGVVARHRVLLRDAQGPLGVIQAEQRLPRLTQVLTGNVTPFASAEAFLCRPDGPVAHCFPTRHSSRPVTVTRSGTGPQRLVHRAQTEGAGVGMAIDYRGRRVLGAFSPVADRGLNAVLAVDVDEIMAPLRKQLGVAVLLVIVMTAGGIGLVWVRVRPLADRLEERLLERTERLQLLHEVDRSILTARSPEQTAHAALERLRPMLGARRAGVAVYDRPAGTARWIAVAGDGLPAAIAAGVSFPLELVGDLVALEQGRDRIVRVSSVLHLAVGRALAEADVEAFTVVPMVADGELLGSLNFSFEGAAAAADGHMEIVREVADQIAVVLRQARLRDENARHATDLERRVEERTRDLQEMTAEMEAFSYSVSHDLRAPLRAMQGFTQALLDDYGDRLDEEGRGYAQRVLEAAKRMDTLIQDLLTYSRLGRGAMVLGPVSLPSTLSDALAQQETSPAGVRVELDASLPLVLAHRPTLVQAVTNLVSNATKYVAAGVEPAVRVHADAGLETVRLWIEDNGIGIAPEHHARIFQVFERLHGRDQYPGTGIGLALVKRVVERMGGRVGVESALGQGSRFWIELRRAPERAAP